MADRVMVLKAGEIRQFDSPVETYLHPADDFVAGFVGHMNRDGRGGAWRPEEVTVVADGGYPARVATSSYVGGHYEIRPISSTPQTGRTGGSRIARSRSTWARPSASK